MTVHHIRECSSLQNMLVRSNIPWIGLAPGEFTASSRMVSGCDWPVPSSPQQSWEGDPGWAPLSRRRSRAPRLFLRLPICTISCEHVALFGSVLCSSVIFRFFVDFIIFLGQLSVRPNCL